jgi:hypothetical protein
MRRVRAELEERRNAEDEAERLREEREVERERRAAEAAAPKADEAARKQADAHAERVSSWRWRKAVEAALSAYGTIVFACPVLAALPFLVGAPVAMFLLKYAIPFPEYVMGAVHFAGFGLVFGLLAGVVPAVAALREELRIRSEQMADSHCRSPFECIPAQAPASGPCVSAGAAPGLPHSRLGSPRDRTQDPADASRPQGSRLRLLAHHRRRFQPATWSCRCCECSPLSSRCPRRVRPPRLHEAGASALWLVCALVEHPLGRQDVLRLRRVRRVEEDSDDGHPV